MTRWPPRMLATHRPRSGSKGPAIAPSSPSIPSSPASPRARRGGRPRLPMAELKDLPNLVQPESVCPSRASIWQKGGAWVKGAWRRAREGTLDAREHSGARLPRRADGCRRRMRRTLDCQPLQIGLVQNCAVFDERCPAPQHRPLASVLRSRARACRRRRATRARAWRSPHGVTARRPRRAAHGLVDVRLVELGATAGASCASGTSLPLSALHIRCPSKHAA